MDEAINSDQGLPEDQPLPDKTSYGYDKDDSISDTDATEVAAITQRKISFDKRPYTTRAGDLVTRDKYSAKPVAKIFYVAFTAKPNRDQEADPNRPVTFFYNGGPGSSSVFGPKRIDTTSFPHSAAPRLGEQLACRAAVEACRWLPRRAVIGSSITERNWFCSGYFSGTDSYSISMNWISRWKAISAISVFMIPSVASRRLGLL